MISNSADVATAQAAASAASSTGKDEDVDASLFARELERSLAETRQSDKKTDSLAATLQRLAAAFPNATVSSRSLTLSSGADTGRASVYIEPDMLKELSGDDDLFARTRDAISSLFATAQNQPLTNAKGGATTRHVTVTSAEVRYTEVERNANGSAQSGSTLILEHNKMMSDLLDMLLASIGGSKSRGGKSNGKQSGSGLDFESLLGGSGSWRLEGFLSMQSLASSRSASFSLSSLISQRQAGSTTNSLVSIEIAIQELSESTGGSTVSGFDFFAYIQMRGLVDPLVLDLGGDGFDLSSAEDGIYFDIRGDGTPAKTAFIRGDNAFLFLDRNGNNLADDANELFGDHGGYANGYEKLRQYDDNGDGVIDANDEVYAKLRLWRDLNGDGICDEGEVMTLAEAGIASLNLNHDASRELDKNGNVIADRSTFTRTDGTTGSMADVWLRSL